MDRKNVESKQGGKRRVRKERREQRESFKIGKQGKKVRTSGEEEIMGEMVRERS